MNEEKPITAEEEISLIDLFAVVIKYRKLILIGTAVATLASGVLYLKESKAAKIKNAQQKNCNVVYELRLNSIPEELRIKYTDGSSSYDYQAFTQNDIRNKTISYLRDPHVIAGALSETCPFFESEGTMTQDEINEKISSVIEGNKVSFYNGSGFSISAKFILENDDATKTDALMKLFEEKASDYVKSLLAPYAAKTYAAAGITSEEIAKIMKMHSSDSYPVAANLQSVQSVAAYMNSANPAMSMTSYRHAYKDGDVTVQTKKYITGIFVAFILLVFSSFVINALKDVKKDKAALEKIKKAWVEG